MQFELLEIFVHFMFSKLKKDSPEGGNIVLRCKSNQWTPADVSPFLCRWDFSKNRQIFVVSQIKLYITPVDWWRLLTSQLFVFFWLIALSPGAQILWSTCALSGESGLFNIDYLIFLCIFKPVAEGCSCQSRAAWRWWPSWWWWQSPGWTVSLCPPSPRLPPGTGATSGCWPGHRVYSALSSQPE